MLKGLAVPLIEELEIRVERKEWNGEDRLDIRLWRKKIRWEQGCTGDETWVPTRKGVHLPFKMKNKLIKYLQSVV